MALKTPEWLARHNCALEAGVGAKTYLVMLAKKPQYMLVPVPLGSKFGCAVTQTINGRRLDGDSTYPTLEDAISGGLEELRKVLGW